MKTILTLAAIFAAASLTSFAVAADKPDKGDPEAAFKKLDTNGDGTVTKEEFMASKKAQKDADKAGKHFEKLDANKDGKVTKEEFLAVEKGKKGDAPAAPAKPDEKKPELPKSTGAK
jgi:hypothetical protein